MLHQIGKLPGRRAILGAAAAAGVLFALPRGANATDSVPTAPRLRKIPSTGEALPIIGLGTDVFRADEEEAIAAEIRRMVQLGGTVIDTAAAYGPSEELIGRVLANGNLRDKVFLATKLTLSGRGMNGQDVGGVPSFERSLTRLQTQRVDLLQIHNLDGMDELMPQLLQWKQAGKVRYIGTTTSHGLHHPQMAAFMRKYPLDFVQVDYSLDNRDAAQEILPLAEARRIAVLANTPFGFGATLRKALARPLPPWAADLGVTSWPQLLLKYVISHSAVTCAIPGSTKVEHLEDNQAAAHGPLPDEAMRQKLEAFWDAG